MTDTRLAALEAVAMALVRHIEGDSVTRDLITDDEWAGYLSDADYVSGLIAAAGYAVVPVEPTREMWAASGNALVNGRVKLKAHHDYLSETVWTAMISASQESTR